MPYGFHVRKRVNMSNSVISASKVFRHENNGRRLKKFLPRYTLSQRHFLCISSNKIIRTTWSIRFDKERSLQPCVEQHQQQLQLQQEQQQQQQQKTPAKDAKKLFNPSFSLPSLLVLLHLHLVIVSARSQPPQKQLGFPSH